MTPVEIISLIVTTVGVASFATIFTILYRNFTDSEIVEVKAGKRDIELIDDFIYGSKSSTVKRRKVFSVIKTVVFYVVCIALTPTLVLSLFHKITGDFTMIGGKGLMVVASGSMSEKHKDNTYLITNNLNDQFNTYDIIVLNEVKSSSQLEKYDVIAYVNNEGVNIIHRIIDVEVSFSGVRYITRGDSNNASDGYHPTFDDVIGVYRGQRIPTVGIFVMFLQSYSGMVTVAALLYCLIMLRNYNTRATRVRDERVKMLKDAIDIDIPSLKNANELKAVYSETIYYKQHAYHFNEAGFVKKEEVDAQTQLASEQTLIRVLETDDGTQADEFVIPAQPIPLDKRTKNNKK